MSSYKTESQVLNIAFDDEKKALRIINVTNDAQDAQIAKSIVDAKGDLIVGTADNTVTRLPVGGTEGHVLTVASSATCGLEWAEASSSTTDWAKIFMFLGIRS